MSLLDSLTVRLLRRILRRAPANFAVAWPSSGHLSPLFEEQTAMSQMSHVPTKSRKPLFPPCSTAHMSPSSHMHHHTKCPMSQSQSVTGPSSEWMSNIIAPYSYGMIYLSISVSTGIAISNVGVRLGDCWKPCANTARSRRKLFRLAERSAHLAVCLTHSVEAQPR